MTSASLKKYPVQEFRKLQKRCNHLRQRGIEVCRYGKNRCTMYKVWHRIWLFLQSPFLAIPEIKNIGLLWAKVRRFCIETTEVLCKEVRCFCTSEMYAHSPQKKFCNNLLHFLHPGWKTIIKPGNFGCRIGCRISSAVQDYLTLSAVFYPFLGIFLHRKRAGSVQFCAKCLGKIQGKCQENGTKTCRILHQSYILHLILHPILHPKLPVNAEGLWHWCRKCRIFPKTFFYVVVFIFYL